MGVDTEGGDPPTLARAMLVECGAEASDAFLVLLPSVQSLWPPFLRSAIPIMRLFTRGLSLALLSFCFLGLVGCAEDNEAAIKEQASKARGRTIPGSRTAQAQTQDEFYEITPGVHGAGTRIGPRPDQGTGYPGPEEVVRSRFEGKDHDSQRPRFYVDRAAWWSLPSSAFSLRCYCRPFKPRVKRPGGHSARTTSGSSVWR